MKFLKQVFDFYITSSIHIALSGYALVRITDFLLQIPLEKSVSHFAFFALIVAYNFVKYDALTRTPKLKIRNHLKAIAFLSFCSFLMCAYYFFTLQKSTQIGAVVFLGLTLLYALPVIPNKKNARNWAGIKIYIVTVCWVGVTVILPILNAQIGLQSNHLGLVLQRFILIFVLILIFEIIDVTHDHPHLQTVPQQIGEKQTKIVGFILILIFGGAEFLNPIIRFSSFGLIAVIALFLAFANGQRSRYYTSFWVESIPIAWWICLLIF